MKKYILLCACVAAVMSSCSNDKEIDAPAPSSRAISFSAAANNASRADVTTQNMTQFTIYGYNVTTSTRVLDGLACNKSGSTWSYSPLAYWMPSADYEFLGIAHSTNYGLAVPEGGVKNNAYYWTFDFDNTKAQGNNDVVVATATRTTGADLSAANGGTGVVPLTFNHILTKMMFAYTTEGLPDQFTLLVSNVQFSMSDQSGEFSPRNITATQPEVGIWTYNTTAYTQGYTITPSGASQNISGAGRQGQTEAHYFVPFTTGTLSFNVAIYQGGQKQTEKTYSVNVANTNGTNNRWGMGQAYLLTMNLTLQNLIESYPINFDVTEVTDYVNNQYAGPDVQL